MQASETKLQELIEGTKQYIIPLFQRPYSWLKSDWQILLDDIMELYDSENPHPHFMGSIVTIQTDSVPEGVPKYLLIDGQQRLTTIFILLAVLRDRAKELEKMKIAKAIHNKYLANIYEEDEDEFDYYKLQPTQVDRSTFYKIIKSDFPCEEKNNISQCYSFFAKEIRKSKNADLDLLKITDIICKSLLLVSILLGKDDNPYLVFESLNAKGRPLTQADLIRNYFFMQIKPNEQDKIYQQYWLPMQNLLGDNLTEFIRHYLTKSGVIVNKNEVYFNLKERINKGQESDAIFYLKDIFKFSQYYARFLNPDLETNLKIRKYLQKINRLDQATVYPFLLNCFDDWQGKKITELELIEILKVIENYILRRFVCNIQTQGLNRLFASLYPRIIKETTFGTASFLEKLKLILQTQNYPKDQEFKEKIMTIQLYGKNRTEKGKLILESLEEFYQHKEQVSFDHLTIEHIMPQSLTDWWINHLGEDYEITHELLLHSLGNLTLTAYNPEMSNSEFPIKKDKLKNSHLELNKYFSNLDSWKREDMEKRAEFLADIALQNWSYFGDESLKFTHQDGVTGTKPKLLSFFDQEYSVRSWRDVLEITLNNLADLEPEKFNEIVEKFPRFLSQDHKNLKATRQLKNGLFVEVGLSAKDIYSFCQKVIEITELSSEDWQIETIDF